MAKWRRRAQPEASVARYLSQLDTADRREPTEALAAKTKHLKEKLAKLDGEMKRLEAYEKRLLASPDQQISSTDPDSRSNGNEWARLWGRRLQRASGRNENNGHRSNRNTRRDNFRFRSSAALTCWQGRKGVDDRGYFNSTEILACQEAGIIVTMPKPMTSGAKSEGRFGKQDFVYLPDEDVYRCLAGGRLTYRYSNEEDGKEATLLDDGVLKLPSQASVNYRPRAADYAMGERHVLEAVQQRLDANPNAMRQRRETVEHPSGTIKARMSATHFLMNTLPKVAAEMALHVLAYNLTHVMNIIGIKPLMAAGQAVTSVASNAPAASVNYLQAF